MAFFSQIAGRQERFTVTALPEREIQGTSSLAHLHLGEVQVLFTENVPGVIDSSEQARADREDLPVPGSHPHLLTLLSLEIRGINACFLFVTALNTEAGL